MMERRGGGSETIFIINIYLVFYPHIVIFFYLIKTVHANLKSKHTF